MYNKTHTTISISKKLKEDLAQYGNKGESFDNIVERLMEDARELRFKKQLFEGETFITIDEALKRTKEQWQ